MKARVKATGEIIEITEDYTSLYAANFDKSYSLDELEFLYVKEKSLPKDEPDYWDKLKHQYAGMALQGILSNPEQIALYDIDCVAQAVRMANLIINKLKEEQK